MIINIILIIIGFIFLIKGSDYLVSGASNFAKRFHIPEIIIGLTIVSLGTTMPEIFVSTKSALQGHTDAALGNAVGSIAANLLLILGLTTMIQPIALKKETRLIETPVSLGIFILFTYICNTGNMISRKEALILIGMLIIFIIYTIIMAKYGKKFEGEEATEEVKTEAKTKLIYDLIKIFVGIAALKFGGDFAVNNALTIASALGMSEKMTGITILAIGTSLPEMVTCISAAAKGKTDIAIGNILGANIFNALLVVGIPALLQGLSFNPAYNFDLFMILSAMIMLEMFAFVPPIKMMSKDNGFIYLMMYITYIINVLLLKA